MTPEQQLQIQRFLDGELPAQEAREIAARVARDREAADLLKEMRNTRQALVGSAPIMPVPESREFYWSKIEREIQRQQPRAGASAAGCILARFRRVLVPAGALVALLLIVIGSLQSGFWGVQRWRQTEMTVADAGAFTYCDYANGTTLVWVGYPAER